MSDLPNRPPLTIFGSFGCTKISDKVLKAYGINWPLDESDPTQKRAFDRMDRIVQAVQEHAWMMETWLLEL